ncbi:MAG: MBL fold metallo-hydrolase [Patescibacteria group bacterium]|jgi:L-ascorbate metabolism protein UlaG (beta-lactamase superfamily)
MIINWFGQSCFKIQGEKSIVVTDPFDKSCGLKVPRLAADIVTISHNFDDTDISSGVKGITENEPFVINGPGEYEIKQVFVYGIPSYSNNQGDKEQKKSLLYRLEIDGISLAHLGNLDHVLANGEIEKLEGVDILMIPVGGTYTINAKQATEIISQLEPRIVIPMAYDTPGLKLKHKIDDIKVFCKEFGACPREEIGKFKVTKKDLPQEDLKVIILQP